MQMIYFQQIYEYFIFLHTLFSFTEIVATFTQIILFAWTTLLMTAVSQMQHGGTHGVANMRIVSTTIRQVKLINRVHTTMCTSSSIKERNTVCCWPNDFDIQNGISYVFERVVVTMI